LAPIKPPLNHLTANFADQDYNFVNNNIDYAAQIGSGAGPLLLKSNVDLWGTFSKSRSAQHQYPAARATARDQGRGGEGSAPVIVPNHGTRVQHRTRDGLLDDA